VILPALLLAAAAELAPHAPPPRAFRPVPVAPAPEDWGVEVRDRTGRLHLLRPTRQPDGSIRIFGRLKHPDGRGA
jgi:hypothetical protein